MRDDFDVVVVGGGHAGCEAALAAARLGCRTLLLTNDTATLARMSCNPAIGGLAKGQVVREVDALGGLMGIAADRTGIQFKVLNGSRGPAVRGLRCQSDKVLYSDEAARIVRATPGLTLAAGVAAGFLEADGRLVGLALDGGESVRCRSAVVTTGTFLRGLIHVGPDKREEGRWGERPAVTLSAALAALGLRLGRMKTGTPPRVHAASLDRGRMEVASGDPHPQAFSFRSRSEAFPRQPQVNCWLTHTTRDVHDLIRENLHRSPLYAGEIVGRGPRYCPSIEDKVVRFAEKERHQVFVEPEGLATDWTYLNGLSMSLPAEVQERVVRSIPGLEAAVILRPAYAVEYDMVWPEQLRDTLETRALAGLFLAGQINGTSGYEEAAGQGLIAGVNAARVALDLDRPPFVLGRHQAYIGVMVDDLVTLGTDEPYRLFSSRAEHRILLGADTAWARLVPLARDWGLLGERDAELILEREARIDRLREALEETRVLPDRETQERLQPLGIELREETTLAGLVRRPERSLSALMPIVREALSASPDTADLDEDELARVESDVRYAGFVRREHEVVRKLEEAHGRRIPEGFRFRGLPGLTLEAAEKLERHRPSTIGQASRIPGVTPAAVTLLLARLAVRAGERPPA